MLEREIADAQAQDISDGVVTSASRNSRLSQGGKPATVTAYSSTEDDIFCDTDSEHMSSL